MGNDAMIKVLVLCGDYWHTEELVRHGLEDWDSEYAFDFVCDAKDILTPEMLAEYPVILNCKSNNLTGGNTAEWFEEGVTEVGPRELAEYVRRGGSLISLHAGNVSNKAYGELVGNTFVTHPPRCEVTIETSGTHPVLQGVENFCLRDEHYQINVSASDADIFLYSQSQSGGRQIAGYTRTLGEGKICVLTPGHILAVWKNEMFKKLLHNIFSWCLV